MLKKFTLIDIDFQGNYLIPGNPFFELGHNEL